LSKKSKAEIVEIEIYDQRYPLRLNTPAERSEVLKVAEQVDLRMRAIAQQSGTVDSLKVAILTALHLAQEQREQSEGDRSLEKAVASGSQKWIRELDNVISCP
jgi:cell division protein ZapA